MYASAHVITRHVWYVGVGALAAEPLRMVSLPQHTLSAVWETDGSGNNLEARSQKIA
jgi:hypothetical protein